ncbi:PilZ domain-containing protein [Pseudoroseomonas globiformis]|uniref:PilZ domain-containing protein n=1 Tax=Teichococcus globiformis TaxID=2307229 RepID=A0ABV7FXV9_9PROT
MPRLTWLPRRGLLLLGGAGLLVANPRAVPAATRRISAAALSAFEAEEAARTLEDRLTLALLTQPSAARTASWEEMAAARRATGQARGRLLAILGGDASLPDEAALAARIKVVLAAEAARQALRRRIDHVAANSAALAPGPGEWRQAQQGMIGAMAALRHYVQGDEATPGSLPAPIARRRSAGDAALPPLWSGTAALPRGPETAGLLATSGAGVAVVLGLGTIGLRLWTRRRGGLRDGQRSEVRLQATLTPSGEAPLPALVFNLSQGGAALRLADPVLLAGERVTIDIAGVGALGALVVQHAGGVLRLHFNSPAPRQAEALARLMQA